MPDLKQVYQELLLDHGRRPRNRRPMNGSAHSADGHNPLCGDRVTVYLEVDGGLIRDVSFEGDGCTISVASASLMTEALRGKKVEEAEEIFRRFHEMLTSDRPASDLGKLQVMGGVREFPVRVKCATLAWHTMKSALTAEK